MKENDRLRHLLKSSPHDTGRSVLSQRQVADLQSQLLHIAEKAANHGPLQKVHSQLVIILEELMSKIMPPESKIRQNSRTSDRNLSHISIDKKNPNRSLSNGPLPRPKSRPLLTNSQRQNDPPRQKYTLPKKAAHIVKSEPLYTRAKKSTSLKSRSPSPFARFDPTQYVLEREARIEERRSRRYSNCN